MESLNNYNIDETFADLSTTNLYTRYFSNHVLQATVTAPVADQYTSVKQPYTEFPKGVKVEFYDGSTECKSWLSADYAVYYTKKKLWEARSNVVVVSETGNKLMTEQLFGDEVKQKIFSVKKVTVIDPDSTVIVGKQGFESDMSFKNYKFLDVNGVVTLSEEYNEKLSDPNAPESTNSEGTN
jgi:LPS export ABC transporter protein LptC